MVVTVLVSTDNNVTKVYNQVKGWVEGSDILDASSIITLVVKLIPIVQKLGLGKGQGEYKKQIVVDVLTMVVRDSKLDSEAKAGLNILVQTTIPYTIDTMIGIANGNIDIAKHAKRCWLGCIGK